MIDRLLGTLAMYQYDCGLFTDSENTMRQSLAIIAKTKTAIYTPLLYAYYAACLMAVNKPKQSDEAAETALIMTEAGNEFWALAEIHRVVAEARYLHAKETKRAVEGLNTAIEIANKQGAMLWAIRSAVSLATLYEAQGDANLAEKSLSIVEKFPSTEMVHADLQQASKLLQQLQRRD